MSFKKTVTAAHSSRVVTHVCITIKLFSFHNEREVQTHIVPPVKTLASDETGNFPLLVETCPAADNEADE